MISDILFIAAAFTAIFPCALSLYLIVTASIQVLWREASPPRKVGRILSVTVLVPAHNEERTLAGCLDALTASTHPALTICVVSDGSTDRTAEIARSFAARGVRLLDLQGNRGKSAALNAALAEITSDLVLVIDADTHVAPDAVAKLAAAFADPEIAAATGNIRVLGERGLLARLQAVEYTSIIGLLKRSNGLWGGLFTVSGAAACYRVPVLRECGGFTSSSVAEDIDLSWRMQRAGWRLTYVPGALASVEVPGRWRDLWRQRVRWSQGLIEVMRTHGGGWMKGRAALAVFTVECVICAAWAVLLASTIVADAVSWLRAPGVPSFTPGFWHILAFGMFICQTLTATLFDSHYARLKWRSLLLAPLYPLYFLVLTLPTSIVGWLRGVMSPSGGRWQRTERKVASCAAAAVVALTAVSLPASAAEKGWREQLSDRGLNFGASSVFELLYSTGARNWPARIDLSASAEADLGTLTGWAPLDHFYIFAMPTIAWGEEEEWRWRARVYQAWLKWDGSEKWNILAGIYDPTWDFHSMVSTNPFPRLPSRLGGEFSPGSPGLLDLYPLSAPAARIEFRPHRNVGVQFAALMLDNRHELHGRPVIEQDEVDEEDEEFAGTVTERDGHRALLLGELNWRTTAEQEEKYGHRHFGLGGWLLPSQRSWGIYSFADVSLWRERGDKEQGCSAFASVSASGGRDRQEDWRCSGGLNYRGLVPRRDNDITAFAIIHETLKEDDDARTAWEVLHRVPIPKNGYMQFTVQRQQVGDWRLGVTIGWDF